MRKETHLCAQCCAVIVAPEWSEYRSDHRVRNVWFCETCGHQFETTSSAFPHPTCSRLLEAA